MYYIIYPILYLLSLLPLRVLYLISDFFYAIAFYLVGYRKQVVLNNLKIAFPNKTKKEHIRIAKDFYHHFIDTLIETIKLLSISEKNFSKRVQIDLSAVNKMAATGKSIQLYAGHQMNWEFVNWAIVKQLNIPWVGIYGALSNKALDKIFYDLRARYGTKLVSAQQFKNQMHDIFSKQYCIGLAADQNPGLPTSGLWLNFFNKPVPFIAGPSKSAAKQSLAGFYVEFVKVKRGYYKFNIIKMFDDGSTMQQAEMIRIYRNLLEECIKANPANYLWSHRRWKFEYSSEFEHLWIDEAIPPKSS